MREVTLSDGTFWMSRPTEADIDAITECCRDPSVGAWTTMPVPYHRSDAEHFIATVVSPGWAGADPVWAIRTAESGPVAGMLGLHTRNEDAAAREIGFWLSPALRGHGIMTRAVGLTCDLAFRSDGLALHRIEWRAKVGNRPSAAVARRAGFRYEGLLRQGHLSRDARYDVWIASRLPGDRPDSAPDWPGVFEQPASSGRPVEMRP